MSVYRKADDTQELEDLRKENARLKESISGIVQRVGETCPVCNCNEYYDTEDRCSRRCIRRKFYGAKPLRRRLWILWKIPARPALVRARCVLCGSKWTEFPPKQLQSG